MCLSFSTRLVVLYVCWSLGGIIWKFALGQVAINSVSGLASIRRLVPIYDNEIPKPTTGQSNNSFLQDGCLGFTICEQMAGSYDQRSHHLPHKLLGLTHKKCKPAGVDLKVHKYTFDQFSRVLLVIFVWLVRHEIRLRIDWNCISGSKHGAFSAQVFNSSWFLSWDRSFLKFL